ncbi:DUF262 domain-containing protein [Streptococcaceae bacterium ESL0687]|nr:DUF262 domain-containing protein [Streptococcaceae bacterium ESL0687]
MEVSKGYLLKYLKSGNVTFFIPPYQRNYEWDYEQCSVFFDDILKTAESNILGITAEHLFGSIVYVQEDTPYGEPDKLILTDGQQRITTTMIFLVALRDIIDNDNFKQIIDNKFLMNQDISNNVDSEYKIKLKQVESDWSAYKNIITNEELTDDDRNSAVFINYEYFVRRLKDLKSKKPEFILENLIEKGLEKFSIVMIQLEPVKNNWENPQEVFESMNSLGKPLSLADLVRNYLLLGESTERQIYLYEKYWLYIEKHLSGEVSNFIRDFMQLKDEKNFKKATPTNFKELYAEFKVLFDGYSTENFLKELKVYSKYYAYIVMGKSTGNEYIDSKLIDLRSINVTILYSFLLSIFSEWDNEFLTDMEIIEILDVLFIYFLRRRIIKLTQAENKAFPLLIKKVKTLVNEDDKRLGMFKILANQENTLRLPNDYELLSGLEVMNFGDFGYCKFILSLVEERMTKSRPSKEDKKLQIEHIMPQVLNESWKKELGSNYEEIHQRWLNNIGNLTLIRHNQELGNKSFEFKREIYENNSGLQIAKSYITDKNIWNGVAIKERSSKLSHYIVDNVLPIPVDFKRRNNYVAKRGKFSFVELDLIGEVINFISDKTLKAKVTSDKEVEFEGKKYRLLPLTKILNERLGIPAPSNQGSRYWEYDGIRLSDV